MINIEKYPECELYRTTLKINDYRDNLIPENCDPRGVYSTIISRAYFSAYSFSLLWLLEEHGFKPRKPEDFEKDKEEFITEHTQVLIALKDYSEFLCSSKLFEMKDLRKLADYDIYTPISEKQVDLAIKNMRFIVKNLKFKFL